MVLGRVPVLFLFSIQGVWDLLAGLIRFLLVGILCGSAAYASVAEDVNISISDWVKVGKVNAKLSAIGVPRSAAVLKRVDKNYVPVNFDFDTTSASYLEFARFEQNQLTFEINKVGGVSRCSVDVAAAARCLGVDLVLDVSKSTWVLSFYDKARNKLKSLVKGPAGDDAGFVKWITTKLNYDGVILDQKKNFRLALVPPTVVAGETQVLLLDGSSLAPLIQSGTNKGAGLLVVKKVQGRYAILELIISQETTTTSKLGDKIIIDRSKGKSSQNENE